MMEQESPNTESSTLALPPPDANKISVEGDNLLSIEPVPQQEEPVYIGVNQMAVEDMLTDIRREAVEHTNDIVKEGLKGDYLTQGAIKDARFDINSRVGDVGKEVDNRFFETGRDLADIRAQVVAQQQQMVAGFLGASKDAEINALKTQIETAKQTTYLSDKIDGQAEKTRELISALNDSSQNRLLIERNTELVAALNDSRFWHRWGDWRDGQSQWQAVNSQLQAFQSQLQETRQGMVNFGTMAGVGQTSTSNNVR